MPCSRSPEQVTTLTTTLVDVTLLAGDRQSSGGSARKPQPGCDRRSGPKRPRIRFSPCGSDIFFVPVFPDQHANLFADGNRERKSWGGAGLFPARRPFAYQHLSTASLFC